MGIPSVVIAYFTVYFKDSVAVKTQGFLGGYSGIVWTVIIVQAVGGLIVATVVKVRGFVSLFLDT
jgi:solute carrier family 35 (UDP-sugar transporter), member A1/2/3